jgi:hypothetical protein
MPDAWEVEWGEEGTFPAPYAGRENPWRPKDDKLLLKLRAGEKPAPRSEVVGTFYDKHSEDDARRRCDELEAFAESYGRRNTQHDGPKGQKKQVQRKSFDVDHEPPLPQMRITCQPRRRSSLTRGFEIRVVSASNLMARATCQACSNRPVRHPKVWALRLCDHCLEDQAASLAGHATPKRPIRRLGRGLSRSASAYSV